MRSPLVRLMFTHALLGVTVGVALVAAMLAFDLFGLGTLVWASADPALAAFLLAFGFAVTFGSGAIGTAIMTLPWDDGRGARRRHRAAALPPPAPVAAGRPRR